MTTQTANVPTTPSQSGVAQERKGGELTISRDKLLAHLKKAIPGIPEDARLPLESEKAITRVVRKATAELLLRGKTPTLAMLIDPKYDIHITVRFWDKNLKRKVEKRVKASEAIRRAQVNLYTELMGKGERLTTLVCLPLLNEKSTPAKTPVKEAVQNCHLTVEKGKPLPKLDFVWIGVDDED